MENLTDSAKLPTENTDETRVPAKWLTKTYSSAEELVSSDAYSVSLSAWLGSAGSPPVTPYQHIYTQNNLEELNKNIQVGTWELRVDYDSAKLNVIKPLDRQTMAIMVIPAVIIRTIPIAVQKQTPAQPEVVGIQDDTVP